MNMSTGKDGLMENVMKCYEENDILSKITDVKKSGLSSNENDFLYHCLPVAVVVIRAILDDDQTDVVDAEFIYANELYLNAMGLSGEDFVGKRYMEKIRKADDQWNKVIYRSAVLGETVRDRLYSIVTETWIDFAVSPGLEKNTCVFAFLPETSGMQRVDSLTELPNRAFFMRLGHENELKLLEKGQTPVVFTCDLLGMKSFNLKYGMAEGDKLLREFAALLKKMFGRTNCARFGEDHFYVSAPDEGLDEILRRFFVEIKLLNDGKNLPVRVGIAKYDPAVPIEMACDRARMASMSVERSMESNYAYFKDEMSQVKAKRYYIMTHINEAMEKGWIVPYYQPVIRTLNGKLCNLEALARWVDPEYGFISPGEFIPVLEENGLSYKLDNYIVEQVAEMLKRRIDRNMTLVPVSVNISRSDFDYRDPVETISRACDSRGIRRELISVEITETSLFSDQQMIESAINRFHKAGFEVWMDDFGSGYSSLNFLKDFDFDEIKIDMLFLRDFNEKSKNIVTMAVRMAKSLGIHTLAEGVETEEHYRFLKSIGCERIQGYYYGRPLPEDELIAHLEREGIECEDKETSSFYQKTGLLNLVSERPLALFFYDGRRFLPVFKNARFERELAYSGMDADEAISVFMNSVTSPVSGQFRVLAEKAAESGTQEVMTCNLGNRFFHFSFTHVAGSRFGHMLSARIDGTVYEERENLGNLDLVVRNLIVVHECIYLVNLDTNTHIVINSDNPEEHNGQESEGTENLLERLKKRPVHPVEKNRFMELLDVSRISERLSASGKGYFTEVFMLKQTDGSYKWKEFIFMALPETEGRRFMICIKPSLLEDEDDKIGFLRHILRFVGQPGEELSLESDFDWWNSLLDHSNLKLFRKDRERRFLGASQAFLDYYGFESEDVILGKTDEDVGWHVDDVPYMFDERRVLEKGEPVINAPGINVVDGKIVHILANKFPVYQNGRIIGLVGYFLDVEKDLEDDVRVLRGGTTDPVTGLLNARGGIDAMLEMDNNLRTNRENYICTQLTVDGYTNVLNDYGKEVARQLIRTVAGIIRDSFAEHAVIARMSGCMFNIFERASSLEESMLEAEKCVEAIESIRYIDDRSCRLSARIHVISGIDSRMERNVEYIIRAGHDEDA